MSNQAGPRLDDATVDTAPRTRDEVVDRLEAAADRARSLDRVDGFCDLACARLLARDFGLGARGMPRSLHVSPLEHRSGFVDFRRRIEIGAGAPDDADATAAQFLTDDH